MTTLQFLVDNPAIKMMVLDIPLASWLGPDSNSPTVKVVITVKEWHHTFNPNCDSNLRITLCRVKPLHPSTGYFLGHIGYMENGKCHGIEHIDMMFTKKDLNHCLKKVASTYNGCGELSDRITKRW